MILADIRHRPIAAIATLVLIILGSSLGVWQLKRAAFKEELALKIEQGAKANLIWANDQDLKPEEAINRKVAAKGVFIKDRGIWLENRPHPMGRDPQTGIATGFYLLMPLQLTGDAKKIIWVNRGWAPRHFEKLNQVPEIVTPTAEVTIEGVALESATKTFALGQESGLRASDGLVIQENIQLAIEQQRHGQPQLPWILRQDNPEIKDGLQRQWPAADTGVQKHLGYAFQWFALALMSLVFWLVTGVRRSRTISKSLR